MKTDNPFLYSERLVPGVVPEGVEVFLPEDLGLQFAQSFTTLPFSFLHSALVISLHSPLIQQLIFVAAIGLFFFASLWAITGRAIAAKAATVRKMKNFRSMWPPLLGIDLRP
jgi:hypothetical protein